MTSAPPHWSEFIDALRSELEGFGELQRLIDHQRQTILQRDADALQASTAAMEDHIPTLSDLSETRRTRQQSLAGTESEIRSVREISQYAPEAFRPLIEALLDETRNMVATTRKHMQQNHVLLQRAHTLNAQLREALTPHRKNLSTYGRKGTLSEAEPLAGAHYAVRT